MGIGVGDTPTQTITPFVFNITPTIEVTQNIHTYKARPPAKIAWLIPRAGFKEILATGILIGLINEGLYKYVHRFQSFRYIARPETIEKAGISF